MKTLRNDHDLLPPILLPRYLCGLKFHQLCVVVGIIRRLNKLHNTIVLQDNAYHIMAYIIEIFH